MREIKFRGWNKQSKMMVSDIQVFSPSDTLSLNSCFDEDMIVLPLQFTGLKDKYGVEIYEGDILKISKLNQYQSEIPSVAPVIWRDRYCAFQASKNVYLWLVNASSEVIGNIYENGDLLK